MPSLRSLARGIDPSIGNMQLQLRNAETTHMTRNVGRSVPFELDEVLFRMSLLVPSILIPLLMSPESKFCRIGTSLLHFAAVVVNRII